MSSLKKYLICYCGNLLLKEDISFATVNISSPKKITILALWTSLLQDDISLATVGVSSSNSFATVDLSSSKKISPLHLWPSPLQRRYLFCHCGYLPFKEDIYFASVDISS
jgi:hypothetical protein